MEPSLRDRQTVFVNRLAYGLKGPRDMGYVVVWGGPRPGDVLVFEHPYGGRLAVKRCLLVPGDEVRVTRQRLYADDHSWRITPEVRAQLGGRNKIPEGFVFVLGENLSASVDSRVYGLIPVARIHGKVLGPLRREARS